MLFVDQIYLLGAGEVTPKGGRAEGESGTEAAAHGGARREAHERMRM